QGGMATTKYTCRPQSTLAAYTKWPPAIWSNSNNQQGGMTTTKNACRPKYTLAASTKMPSRHMVKQQAG
ncbi:hypothetical protein NDU88_006740, partial [Pleurodeles waltl]